MIDAREYKNYRDVVVAAAADIAKNDPRVVFLDADLSSCIGSTAFKKAFPDRFFNCGIAEANMAAVAGGMASAGLVPFIHSFGCFASRRAYDQLFLSVGYTGRVVHVIGSDPGVTAQYNGGTHMPFEDIALLRQIPSFNIVEPSDGVSLAALTEQLYAAGKPSYIRTPRKGINFRYPGAGEIKLGKAVKLRDGSDVAIIATGAVMVDNAIEAADLLEKDGIKATVLDLHTIRPLDTDAIEAAARATGHVVVAENGRYPGGVGEMVATHLAKTCPVKMDFLNVGLRYGEVGSLAYLKDAFGFTGANLAEKAKALLK